MSKVFRRAEKQIFKANEAVKAWNNKYSVGQAVTVLLDSGEIRETRTISTARVMCESPVIWLDGVSGCYLLDRVKEPPTPEEPSDEE